MSVPNVPGCYKCVVHQHIGVVLAETVIHVIAGTSADQQLIANDVGLAWVATNSIKAIQTNEVKYDGIDVQKYDGSAAPTNHTVTGFTGTFGGATGTSASVQVCEIITLRTLLSGKSHRGRMYVLGGPVNQLDSPAVQWSAGWAGTIQLSGDAFFNSLLTATTVDGLAVFSRHLNEATVVSSTKGRRYLGSQRRRAEQLM